MKAILLKLEQTRWMERIDRVIPFAVLLAGGYFVGCWLYAICCK